MCGPWNGGRVQVCCWICDYGRIEEPGRVFEVLCLHTASQQYQFGVLRIRSNVILLRWLEFVGDSCAIGGGNLCMGVGSKIGRVGIEGRECLDTFGPLGCLPSLQSW